MGDKSRVFATLIRSNLPIYGWTGGLWAVAIFAGVVLSQGRALPSLWIVGGLAVLAAVAERQSVPVTRNTEASVAFLPLVFAAVAFGPFAALALPSMGCLFADPNVDGRCGRARGWPGCFP